MPPLSRSSRSPSLEIQEVRAVTNKRRRPTGPSSSPGNRRSVRLQQAVPPPPPTTIVLDDSDDENDEEELFVTQPKKIKLDEGDHAAEDGPLFPRTTSSSTSNISTTAASNRRRILDDHVIDLASDEAPAAAPSSPPAPVVAAATTTTTKKPGRIEFAAFQCAICMDNATNLAVTHCGHMFCSECLQSALNTEATRNKCPICRQKIETRDRETYNSKTKGFWHLELKPMTANKKGKQAAR